MVTMQEIADKLGINKSTVSKALKNSGDLNEKTVELIRKTAIKMGYVSHRKMIDKDSTIGIIYPEIDDGMYWEIVSNLTKKVEDEGFRCLALPFDFSNERAYEMFSYLVEKKVAGIFLIQEDFTKDYKIREESMLSGISIIRISFDGDNSFYDNIWINEIAGVRDAVAQLVKLGHRDIAYIGDSKGLCREKIIKDVLEESGLSVNDDLFVTVKERNYNCGYEGAIKLLSQKNRFTAIISQYDAVAIGAIRALYEAGKKVPDDCSVIGIEDAGYSKYMVPSLSTVNNNLPYLCSVAFALMRDKIYKRNEETQSVYVNSKFISRESVGPAINFETK